ncbi:sodium/proton-translocating pyrophosphatase, partial [Flavobacterium sp.]
KCVDISTKAALREMMLPGIMTIGFPIAIVLLGKLVYGSNNQLIAEMLGGYMAGVTVSGVLWAVFQNNAGGAWDNAKKSFEAGVLINGEMTFKGSDAHKAAVTGDTVGDPFKDTSGPSMNILIKLTCLIGLVIAPILGNGTHSDVAMASCCSMSEKCASMSKEECAKMGCADMTECKSMSKDECMEKGCTSKTCKFMNPQTNQMTTEVSKEVRIEKTSDNGKVTAKVTTTVNGKEDVLNFEGTETEVQAKIDALK